MTATPHATVRKLTSVPRTTGGDVDVDAAVGRLRRFGRVHRFESPPGVARASGWAFAALATDAPVDVGHDDVYARIDLLCRRFGIGPGAGRERPGPPFTGGLVVALPYDGGDAPRPLRAVVEPVELVVAARGRHAWLATRRMHTDAQELHELSTTVADELAGGSHQPPATVEVAARDIVESSGRERYRKAVSRVLERIRAGDVYVVNVTQRLDSTWPGDVHALYEALRRLSRAPHGAVVEFAAGGGLASVSPETFLRAEGRRLCTRPIKGTRPRARRAERDEGLARELAESAKERAENVMVVDLERNDLGMICDVASVSVTELCRVERHPTVWQLVSTVEGWLRDELGYGAALAACLPSGSVTGAPKSSARRLIAEVEDVSRGWYCGALGWISAGTMDTAVTIRTAVLAADRHVSYGTGAGIVADSDPAAEYDETRAKAAAFAAAVNGRFVNRP